MDRLKVLVVDDESRMRKLVKDFLVKSGFEVVEAEDGEQAVDVFYADKDISLIILDVMMPKMNGYDVCRTIRKDSKVPIIMLTAKSEEQDELAGFNLGVDEYISKPFSPKILVARVEAILRRTNAIGNDKLEYEGIEVDKTAHYVRIDGEEVELSYKEFELLTYFIENKGIARWVKKAIILKLCGDWGINLKNETFNKVKAVNNHYVNSCGAGTFLLSV